MQTDQVVGRSALPKGFPDKAFAGGTVALWEMNGGTMQASTSLGVPNNFDIVSKHYDLLL